MDPQLGRIGIGAFALLAAVETASAQNTTIVSVQPNGLPSAWNCRQPSMSADGRFVAFTSESHDIAPGGVGYSRAFVRDRTTGVTQGVSVDSSGTSANEGSGAAILSADGAWVTFTSWGTNLVAGDTNGAHDVFLRDLVNGTTTRVSVSSSGAQAAENCMGTAISGDGRFVVFQTVDALVQSDVNGVLDVYVHDRITGVTSRASVSSTGAGSVGECTLGSISADGQRVAFLGAADDLVPGDANGFSDAFVHDRSTGTTILASVSTSGTSGDMRSLGPRISGDGNTVVFASFSTNLVSPPPPPNFHAFARDMALASTSLVDVSSSGVAGSGPLGEASFGVSHDGRFVTFTSRASNLVPGDAYLENPDLFVRDRGLGTTLKASFGAVGQQIDDGLARWASISDDGRYVAFHCESPNLAPGDVNGGWDVFVRDFGGTPTGSALCFGDGSGTACPCGNNGTAGRGCGNSPWLSGAEFFAMGEPSVSADTLKIGARMLPASTSCLFFQGTATLGGGLGVPFGDGLRCAGGTVARLATRFATSVGLAFHPRPNDPPISVTGAVTSAPATRVYQVWYRNSAPFCTASTFNLTNAVEVHWAP